MVDGAREAHAGPTGFQLPTLSKIRGVYSTHDRAFVARFDVDGSDTGYAGRIARLSVSLMPTQCCVG